MSGCSEGRVSSMPGSVHKVPEGQMCDHEGHNHPAEVRIQGETDSMGCEFIDLCKPEADKLLAELRAPKDGFCDLHGGMGSDIKDWRDYDEGMAGPLYKACKSCRLEANQRAAEEYEEMRRSGSNVTDFEWDDDEFDGPLPAFDGDEGVVWQVPDEGKPGDFAALFQEKEKQ